MNRASQAAAPAPTLASLIQAHRATAAQHEAACDRFNECERASAPKEEARSAMAAAGAVDDAALMAVCRHRCGSLAEVGARAAYLRTTSMFDELAPEPEFVDALLNSMVPAEQSSRARKHDHATALEHDDMKRTLGDASAAHSPVWGRYPNLTTIGRQPLDKLDVDELDALRDAYHSVDTVLTALLSAPRYRGHPLIEDILHAESHRTWHAMVSIQEEVGRRGPPASSSATA